MALILMIPIFLKSLFALRKLYNCQETNHLDCLPSVIFTVQRENNITALIFSRAAFNSKEKGARLVTLKTVTPFPAAYHHHLIIGQLVAQIVIGALGGS